MHEFTRVRLKPGPVLDEVTAFLASSGLALEADLEIMLISRFADGSLQSCGGLAKDVLKCLAIDPRCRGEGLALSLVSELRAIAWERGMQDLFLYTKPENEALFRDCGFHTLARVPDAAVLMENSPDRLRRYQDTLAAARVPGSVITALVMNCNPFTLGHRHLVEQALAVSGVVHLFLVREDLSLIPYADRLDLVRQGTADLPNVFIHPGSEYILSRATFPQYFLKDEADVNRAFTGIDLQIFRVHIAPFLGITKRMAGEEPGSAVTRRYNQDMAYWLETDALSAPPIRFSVIPRLESGGKVISASRVRALWQLEDYAACASLVPPATLNYLQQHRPRLASGENYDEFRAG